MGRNKSLSRVGNAKAAVCEIKHKDESSMTYRQTTTTTNLNYVHTLPEPVMALPHISRPNMANGMHAAYTCKEAINKHNNNVPYVWKTQNKETNLNWSGLGKAQFLAASPKQRARQI